MLGSLSTRLVFASLLATLFSQVEVNAQGRVDFSRDIRPILSDACFKCHGPDKQQRQADLRLDTKEGLFRDADGTRVVVPKKLAESELYARIKSGDPDYQMPPHGSGLGLKPAQIALIKRWIEQGAEWKRHWSFEPPRKSPQPNVKMKKWVRNPIDAFVLKRLEDEGLQPSVHADARVLLRRVYFDLTGLPPSNKAQTSFLMDCQFTSVEQALGNVVDRLLDTPEYAERMSIRWLDAARYADTSGYQSDGPRFMWRWRDWVIESFRQNMPFDQFTIEQLAGDLLPNATRDQILATAFNRNHRGNAEGGIVPEEFQVEYVVDRVDTTATIWLGLTMGCARCHSHKYDPISQREYYQMFAYFNNIPESGRALKEGNSPPVMKAPTRAQEKELADVTLKREAARQAFKKRMLTVPDEISTWAAKQTNGTGLNRDWTITEQAVAFGTLDPSRPNTFFSDGEEITFLIPPTLTEIERESRVTNSSSKTKAWQFDGKHHLEIGKVAKFGYFDKFSLGGWIFRDNDKAGTVISKMELVNRGAGYNLHISDSGKLQLNLVKRWLDDSLRVETIESIPSGEWVHVFATYDGSRVADGITLYVNGTAVSHRSNLDGINQTFANDEPLRIATGNSSFVGSIRDAMVFSREVPADEVAVISEASPILLIVGTPRTNRTRRQTHKLTRYFLDVAGDEKLRKQWRALTLLERRHASLLEDIPTVMVMRESQPRATHILTRGEYNRPGERVEAGVPAALPPLPDSAAKNRLALARWLVSGNNPLTARVTINRLWRDFFGVGLVKTTEDFGSQGARPSHPELLDWLAVEFVDSGWDLQHMIRLFVMSNAYRQTSKAKLNNWKRDPENRLLSRGPRFRLPAEMIRDQALAVSGLLNRKVGGPSVKPYQPKDLWKEIATDQEYDRSKDGDQYRRSIYTFWKRTVAPPMMMTFDASGREMCEVRMTRTNTPLQALNLMNDVTFVEAARVLAQSVLQDKQATGDSARLRMLFERTLCRLPSKSEQQILLKSVRVYRQEFGNDPKGAKDFTEIGDRIVPRKLDRVELATWSTIASTIMNLDEAVTKE